MAITQDEFNVLMEQWLIDNGGQYSSAHTGAVIDAAVTAVKAKEAVWDAKVSSLSVGTTTTGDPGTNAAVVNSGTDAAPVFDFTVPRGGDGFSPTVTEDESNSVTSYKLNISNKDGQFTTPNLQAVSFVENAQVYSQEEKLIGTWIDGKPVYRITYLMTTPSAGGQHAMLDTTSLNIDTLTKPIECILQALSGTPVSKINSNYYGANYKSENMTAATAFTVCIINNELLLSMGVGATNRRGQPFTVVIEYTKTTDEATVAVATAEELNTAYDEGVQGA